MKLKTKSNQITKYIIQKHISSLILFITFLSLGAFSVIKAKSLENKIAPSITSQVTQNVLGENTKNDISEEEPKKENIFQKLISQAKNPQSIDTENSQQNNQSEENENTDNTIGGSSSEDVLVQNSNDSNTDDQASPNPTATQEALVTPTPTPSSVLNSEPTATPLPTIIPTTPTPTPVATPETKQNSIFSSSVFPKGNFTPDARGSVNVEITDTYSSGFVQLNMSGSLNKLRPNQVYKVYLCDDYNCGTNTNPEIKTDDSGSVNFFGVNFSHNQAKSPAKTIKVYEKGVNGAEVNTSVCQMVSLNSTPCLQGNISL